VGEAIRPPKSHDRLSSQIAPRYYVPMGKDHLTLKDALKNGDLEAFMALAEAEGFGAADAEAFKRALTAAVKPQKSKRQTLRSPSRDCPPGKRTR
jgi:hypothetical protein